MGKARSFRLTAENEIRLKEIMKLSTMDNENRAFNEIIANYHEYLKHKDALMDFISFIKKVKSLV